VGEGWAAWLSDHHEDESAAARSVRLARQAESRDDRRAERTESERLAALAERREVLEVAALQAGMVARTTNDIFTDAMRLGDEDAKYNEALEVIRRIDRKREARQREQAARAQLMTEVGQLASRSAPDLLAPAKAMLAGHREYVTASRSKMREAAAGTPRQPRPFAGPGNAARSEVTCEMCKKYGATAEQSFLIHSDPSPAPAPAVPSEDEQDWLSSRQGAERRQPGRYAEAVR
jgi:hypothetical protein